MVRFQEVDVDLSGKRVEKIARSYRGEPKIRNLYTDVNDQYVPPKWLMIVTMNLHHDDLISYDAVDTLNELGFQTYANRKFDSQKLHNIKHRPLTYR